MAIREENGFHTNLGAWAVLGDIMTALVGSTLRLFKDGFAPTPVNLEADYIAQEADFDGYAAGDITAWAGPYFGADGRWRISVSATFFKTAGIVTNSIGGGWVSAMGGGTRFAFLTSVPLAMTETGNFIQVDLDIMDDLTLQVVTEN